MMRIATFQSRNCKPLKTIIEHQMVKDHDINFCAHTESYNIYLASFGVDILVSISSGDLDILIAAKARTLVEGS